MGQWQWKHMHNSGSGTRAVKGTLERGPVDSTMKQVLPRKGDNSEDYQQVPFLDSTR